MVSQKTGLSEELDKVGVQMIVGFIRQKLPAPIASQLDSALAGSGMVDKAGDVVKELGKPFE